MEIAILLVIMIVAVIFLISYTYNQSRLGSGEIVITEDDEGIRRFTLDLDEDPENLLNKKKIVFRVISKI